MIKKQEFKEINKTVYKIGHVVVQLQMFVRWSTEDTKKKMLNKTTNSKNNSIEAFERQYWESGNQDLVWA